MVASTLFIIQVGPTLKRSVTIEYMYLDADGSDNAYLIMIVSL
jgi:hypothetical protein